MERALVLDDTDAVDALVACLEQNPRDAKYYGVTIRDDGSVDPADARGLADHMVVITITLS